MKFETWACLLVVLIPLTLSGQLVFESVELPEDCSITSINISPTGEQFIQLRGHPTSIYTSTDSGTSWTKEDIHSSGNTISIDFFEDGTPIIHFEKKVEDHDVIIRNDGNWQSLNPLQVSGLGATEAYIVNDTLFFFQNGAVYSSYDKGTTYQVEADVIPDFHVEDIVAHKDYIVCMASGIVGQIKVYKENGLWSEAIIPSYDEYYFIDTEEILFKNQESISIYNFVEDSISTCQLGVNAADCIEGYSWDSAFTASKNYFYHTLKDGSIFKSSNLFSGIWEECLSFPNTIDQESITFDNSENLYGFSLFDNQIFTKADSLTTWSITPINIAQPFIFEYEETGLGTEVVLTANKIFIRNDSSDEWLFDPNLESQVRNIETGSNNEIYMYCGDYILTSNDNTFQYDTLISPNVEISILNKNHLYVLNDSIMVLIDSGYNPSYYSSNKGQDWHTFDLFYQFEMDIRLIDDNIYITTLRPGFNLIKIELETNAVTSISETNSYQIGKYPNPTLLSNGSAVIQFGNTDGEPVELYSLDFSNGFQYIMDATDLITSSARVAVENDIYTFSHDKYQIIKNGDYSTYNLSGLAEGFHNVITSNTDHFLSVTNFNSLYRSSNKISDTIHTEVSSTSDFLEHFDISVSPNPTKDQFTLTLENQDIRLSQITIYNDHGQLMTTRTTDQSEVSFDSSQYPAGVYIVKVQVGDQVVSRKLVVM